MNRKSPLLAAKEVLASLGCSKPGDLSIEEMVFALGGVLKESPLKGSEGRILMNNSSAVITVNSDIVHSGKRNFVIAHELGHFVLHKGVVPLFSDTEKTLADWYKNGPQEQEANTFASELLMPSLVFKELIKGKRLSLALIEDVAYHFNVSLTAAFLKYRILGDYPLMVIYIEEGLIKWKQASSDFPFQFLPINSKVPAWTVAGDFFNGNGLEERPEKVDAIEWFPEDFNIRYKEDWKLWEQCFKVSHNGLIACLWTF